MKNNRAAYTSERKGERGTVLAYTVLSVLFLFFAVGLGVDLSHLYLVKAELQNSADAAALAGASALTNPNPGRIATAVDRALLVLNQNKYNFNRQDYVNVMTLANQRALVRFAVNLSDFDPPNTGLSEAAAAADPDDIRFVRVITPDVPVNIFFSIPLLGLQRQMTAKAVSGLSIPGNVSVCIAPLSAVYDPNQDMPATFWGDCPVVAGRGPNDLQPVPPSGPDPDGNGTCNPKREFCKRCTYTMRAAPASGPSAGNYQILRCAGNGNNEVRDALAAYNNCRCGLQSVGGDIDTQPGVGAGPVRQGLNVRFDVYGGGINYSSSIPPDTNIAQGTSSGQGTNQTWSGISWGEYGAGSPFAGPASAHPGVTNRRVLIIPTIPIGEFSNGQTTVTIGGLGGFFMRSQVGNGNNGDIKAEYIGDDITSVIGFDPNDTNTTNIVTPVLYR